MDTKVAYPILSFVLRLKNFMTCLSPKFYPRGNGAILSRQNVNREPALGQELLSGARKFSWGEKVRAHAVYIYFGAQWTNYS